VAGGRRQLRDPGTHDPGADDSHSC
jgi:hypothetical protein